MEKIIQEAVSQNFIAFVWIFVVVFVIVSGVVVTITVKIINTNNLSENAFNKALQIEKNYQQHIDTILQSMNEVKHDIKEMKEGWQERISLVEMKQLEMSHNIESIKKGLKD